jgi:hypothetical protein
VSSWETEAGESQVQSQPGIHNKTLSHKNEKKKKTRKEEEETGIKKIRVLLPRAFLVL